MPPAKGTDKPRVTKRRSARVMDVYRFSPVPLPFLKAPLRSFLVARAERSYAKMADAEVDLAAMDRWYQEHTFFFGFAVFRSGSTFLANLLNETLPSDIVLHEPNLIDYYFYTLALQDGDAARRYIENYRSREIFSRVAKYSFGTYGEINPFLRRHCRAIHALPTGVRTFHLVRDGRKVVTSLMSREIFDTNDPMTRLVYPPTGDPYGESWANMSRFERVCWLWQADNRFMREATGHTVQLEGVLGDYDYFRQQVLDYLGLSVPEADWRRYIEHTRNRTPRYRLRAHRDWTAEQHSASDRICGDEMAACGYS